MVWPIETVLDFYSQYALEYFCLLIGRLVQKPVVGMEMSLFTLLCEKPPPAATTLATPLRPKHCACQAHRELR